MHEELARVRLEGHHRGRHAERVRLLSQLREQCLVAEVHAIEIADGQRDRGVCDGRDCAEDLHEKRDAREKRASIPVHVVVPGGGLEPPHLAAADFESAASTNFATQASGLF